VTAAPGRAAQRPLRAVLIDIDGTLIDSNEAHARAWADILRDAGWPDITWQQVKPLIGMGGDKLLPELTGLDAESPKGKRLSKERTEHFMRAYLPSIQPFPKVRELMEAFRARGLLRIIATSAGEEELDALLGRAGVADLITRETTKDDAGEKSKPDPDVIHAALAKAHAAPDEAIMLGDTPYDILAAQGAGVGTIAVRSGGWGDRELAGAVAIYADAAELLERLGDSPVGA
jgi:HAD superfamily hydrolase (TIGR01509 family)